MAARSTKRVTSLADTPLELSHTVNVRQRTPAPLPPIPDRPASRVPAIEYPVDEGYATPRREIVIVDNNTSRYIDSLEGRLSKAERTTEGLLENAYKIKEDIIENLKLTQGTREEDAHARHLLREHIRNITEVVKRLSKDIQGLEGEIRSKDQALHGASDNLKNLEIHHVAGVTDLRGRVARCDASISRLSLDLRAANDNIKAVSQQHQDSQSKQADRLAQLEHRVSDLYNLLDKKLSEQSVQLQRLQSDVERQVASVEARTKAMVDDLKNALASDRQYSAIERDKLESRMVDHVERQLLSRDARYEKFEKQIEENLVAQHKWLARLEDENQKERDKNKQAFQHLETKISQSLEVGIKKQDDEIKRLKAECREGFATVHESISNMKQVLDGKRKLLEEQLRKDIAQIRKMVVLI